MIIYSGEKGAKTRVVDSDFYHGGIRIAEKVSSSLLTSEELGAIFAGWEWWAMSGKGV